MSHKLAAAGLLLVAPVMLTACSGTVQANKADVEAKISQGYQQQKNVKPDAVTCPGDLKGKKDEKMTCSMTVAGKKLDVDVVVTDVKGKQVFFDWKAK